MQSWALLPESTAKPQALRRDLVRIRKGIDRLLTAYQEGLLPIEELRERMPGLRRREHAHNAELQAIVDQSVGRAAYLRLADTPNTFLTRLRSSAGPLTYQNASASCNFSSRKSSSAMTKLSSGTVSLCQIHRCAVAPMVAHRRRGRKVQSFMPCRSCKATAELQGNRPRAALAVIDATVTAIKRSTWMQRE